MNSNTEQASHRANLTGILWMIASMAAFSVEDVFIKTATRELPVGQVLVLFGMGGAALFAFLVWRSGSRLLSPEVFTKIMLVRAFFELIGRLFYALAIALTPISSATAIIQATPLIVVLGATVFFGEKVGWRQWCAVVAGLIGVSIILRPTSGDFSSLSLLAVLGTVGFAGRDLASRASPASLSTSHLGLYGFLTVVVAGVLFTLWDGRSFLWLTMPTLLGVLAAICVGVFAYTALMKAMRTGSISSVTPFRYTRLIFGITVGVVIFGEKLDGPMLIGCLIVIGAGLSVWWQGKRVGRSSE